MNDYKLYVYFKAIIQHTDLELYFIVWIIFLDQKCYERVIKQQQEKNSVNQYVPLVTVLAITITLLMVLAVGFKLKWKKCLCGKKNKSTEVFSFLLYAISHDYFCWFRLGYNM
uniref:Uncharacterized protein n=1 Tax=Magallana gigas TaxID=29159 RepID=K1PLH4_MAGGI